MKYKSKIEGYFLTAGIGLNTGMLSILTGINYMQGESYGFGLTASILSGIAMISCIAAGIKGEFNKKSSELEAKLKE